MSVVDKTQIAIRVGIAASLFLVPYVCLTTALGMRIAVMLSASSTICFVIAECVHKMKNSKINENLLEGN